jgi:hypothetical protein
MTESQDPNHEIFRLDRALRIAQFCGQIAARITILRKAGQDKEADAWVQKKAAWKQRLDNMASQLPAGSSVRDMLDIAEHRGYADNVDTPSKQ